MFFGMRITMVGEGRLHHGSLITGDWRLRGKVSTQMSESLANSKTYIRLNWQTKTGAEAEAEPSIPPKKERGFNRDCGVKELKYGMHFGRTLRSLISSPGLKGGLQGQRQQTRRLRRGQGGYHDQERQDKAYAMTKRVMSC